jgi:hypothetical protein
MLNLLGSAAAGLMKSMFVPSASGTPQVHHRTPGTLKQISCLTNLITGEVEFEELDKLVSGTIRDVHFSEGAMKYALDVSLVLKLVKLMSKHCCGSKTSDGEALVAKRFYCVHDGNDSVMALPIAILDNCKHIYEELCCLALTVFLHSLSHHFVFGE